MKLSTKCVLLAIAALAANDANAFAPMRQAARLASRLDVTTLEEWQVLDNGSVVGSVRGHPTLNDGDIITTSPLATPGNAKSAEVVQTLSGSKYKLGKPMQLKRNGSTEVSEGGPGVGRETVLKGGGLVALFAGGLAAGYGISGSLKGNQMTVPEVRSDEFGQELCLVLRLRSF